MYEGRPQTIWNEINTYPIWHRRWMCCRHLVRCHRPTQHNSFWYSQWEIVVYPDDAIKWRWLYTDSRGFLCLFRVNWCFMAHGSTELARHHLGRGPTTGHENVAWLHRADSRFAPSQWETSLQGNAISHWLGTNRESIPLYNNRQADVWCISLIRSPQGCNNAMQFNFQLGPYDY